MEIVHILGPLGIGVLLTFFSLFDERIITWKMASYLNIRVPAVAVVTITNVAVGSASLATFIANSLVFLANLLMSFTLYENPIVRTAVVFVAILFVFALFYGIIMLLLSKDIVDIVEHKYRGRYLTWWLRSAQIIYNVASLALIGVGLYLSAIRTSAVPVECHCRNGLP